GSSTLRAVNLTTATHAELMGSGNVAYIQLYMAYMKLESKNESLNLEVAHLRGLTNTLVGTSHTPSTSKQKHPVRTTSTISQSNSRPLHHKIPRSEDRENYPGVPYWSKAEWVEFCDQEKDAGRVPDRLGFLTDEDGHDVDKNRIKMMTDTAKMLWNGLKEEDMAPVSWKRKSDKAGLYFSSRMLTEFVEFRLDNGRWKIELFATIKYPDWTKLTSLKTTKRRRNNENEPKPTKRRRASSPPPGASVIEIDDDQDQEATSDAHSATIPVHPHALAQPITSTSSSTSLQTSNPMHALPQPSTTSSTRPGTSTTTTQTASTTVNTQTSGPSMTPSLQQPTPSETSNTLEETFRTPVQTMIPTQTMAPASSLSTLTVTSAGPTASLSAGLAMTASEATPRTRTNSVLQDLSPSRVSTPTIQASTTDPGVPPTSLVQSTEARIQAESPNHARPRRVATRRALNPLKNLEIPPPTDLVALTEPLNDAAASLPRKSNAKLLKAKEGVTTARNLFLLDYLKDHPNYEGTEGQFSAIWKASDAATRMKYEELSKSRTKERKKAPPGTSNSGTTTSTSKTAGASAPCSGDAEHVG
ncbi:hypothetical protein H0H93_009400, partial [Arthromyces matolae]